MRVLSTIETDHGDEFQMFDRDTPLSELGYVLMIAFLANRLVIDRSWR